MTNMIKRWSIFEIAMTSTSVYDNPLQDVSLMATFVSEQGVVRCLDGFWDGGDQWRVRFSPPSAGRWRYSTECSDPRNVGLHGLTDTFMCVESAAGSRFEQHGPIQVEAGGCHFVHVDGTPYFYLADTAWNGPLFSTDEEWQHYLDVRVQQGFTAVQWVPTQWITAPHGDLEARLPFEGHERITINPAVFQRLDNKLTQLNQAGMLGAVVLLWAADWGDYEVMRVNPGLTLPEDQAVLLARYMVARWGAYAVLWLLAGDAEYRGARAGRWQRIGQSVFGGREHAPVALHPNGMSWHADEFRSETWLDFTGYQGCHFGDDNALTWAVFGPPATEWLREPHRPIINLEPPYEHHLDLSNPEHRFSDDEVRRAIYWSLLVSPTAGVTYGGHGVWGWDDGTQPPTAHPTSGVPLAWRDALRMPAAEQIFHLSNLFNSISWWTLKPDATLVKRQPGDENIRRYVAASRSQSGDLALVYIPQDTRVAIDLSQLLPHVSGEWLNPRTGEANAAASIGDEFETPGAGDWILLLKASR